MSGETLKSASVQQEEIMAKEYRLLIQDFPTLGEIEKRYIKIVLEKTGGRKDRTAKILGINRRTLYRKEREYGLATLLSPYPS